MVGIEASTVSYLDSAKLSGRCVSKSGCHFLGVLVRSALLSGVTVGPLILGTSFDLDRLSEETCSDCLGDCSKEGTP